jgi:hypothetical protein
MTHLRRLSTLALTACALTACADADAAPDRADAVEADVPATASAPSSAMASTDGDALPTVLVYKSPTCGCCNGWVEHLESAGFTVDARNVRDLMSVKVDGGVPTAMSSCHTAIIDGYVVEGHVPAEQVKRLLDERPDVAGIAVPGMPVGSPGMEGPNAEPYQVWSFTHDGQAAVFADVDPR